MIEEQILISVLYRMRLYIQGVIMNIAPNQSIQYKSSMYDAEWYFIFVLKRLNSSVIPNLFMQHSAIVR